jgi:hypothetical protein
MSVHSVCTVNCKLDCPDNIANRRTACPLCKAQIQVWRLSFAIKHVHDPKVIADSVTWAVPGESLLHTLIHVPESY